MQKSIRRYSEKTRLLLDTFQRNYFAPRIVFCVADRTQGLVSYKKSKNIEGIRKKHAGEFKQWKLAILYVTFPQSVLFILKANLTTRIPL